MIQTIEKMLTGYFNRIGLRRMFMMVVGNIFLGLGVSIFKLSGMGTDPYNGMIMALADCFGIAYQHFMVLFNIGLLLIEFVFGRQLIGAGTVVNACFLGYIVTFFHEIWIRTWGQPAEIWHRLLQVSLGVAVISLGVSLYQTADAGVAPWDSISLIMKKRWPKISYFWHRMSNDILAVVVCFLTGGIVGIGTAVCALGLGPVVQLFNRSISEKLTHD